MGGTGCAGEGARDSTEGRPVATRTVSRTVSGVAASSGGDATVAFAAAIADSALVDELDMVGGRVGVASLAMVRGGADGLITVGEAVSTVLGERGAGHT